jgi:hypothetical protein
MKNKVSSPTPGSLTFDDLPHPHLHICFSGHFVYLDMYFLKDQRIGNCDTAYRRMYMSPSECGRNCTFVIASV